MRVLLSKSTLGVRAYEVGPDQRMTVLTVANLLQEAAGNHAVAMWGRSESGFASDPRLTELGLIFVMARLCIDMRRYPRWGELVRMETWFQAAGRVGAERQWLLQAGNSGEILGRASAQFVMLHAATRKLVKMPSSVRETSAWFQRSPPLSAIAPAQGRAKLPAVRSKGAGVGAAGAGRGESSESAVALPLSPSRVSTPLEVAPLAVTARRADMDMNGHVNNVAYLCWALESVPEAVHGQGTLRGVEADFMAESTAGQTIEGLAHATPAPDWIEGGNAAFAHSLVRPDEGGGKGTELARLRSTWEVPEDVAAKLRRTKA
ncbi:acyl-ACP thioesterase [Helicosporidium sp. ATCC 50920]|nr:acyl-ACP thioesterase [Helicosporidium sp. ATCC 50920]|eukprot:KDD73325.1 acyl-ACP thioesterase [Helicosporidium sp. ATCC 50920]